MIDDDLLPRIERADAAIGRDRVRAIGCEAVDCGGGVVLLGGAGSPWTSALGLAIGRRFTSEDAAEVRAIFRRARTPCSITVSSHADPSLLRFFSATHGLTAIVDVLAHDLRDVEPPDASWIVEDARDDEWESLAVAGFGDHFSEGLDEAELRRLSRSLIGLHGVRRLVARRDGEAPVAIGALAMREGIGLLTSAATHPAHRGQGAHAALMRARLQIARDAGCIAASVWCRPGSGAHRAARRAGFELAFTRLRLDERPRDSHN